jgi:hypothetical protein
VYIGGYDYVLGEDLPSVKHLLADLCNAINERRKYYLDSKIAWKIADGTTKTDPVPDDFKGMRLNSNQDPLDGHVLPEVLVQLLSGIGSCLINTTIADFGISLKDTGYFTDATYTTRWTWDTLLADVGLLDYGEVSNLNNWRSPLWWLTLRGVVERLRYLEIQAGMDLGGGDAVYSGPEIFPYETTTRSDLWDDESGAVGEIYQGAYHFPMPYWVGYTFGVTLIYGGGGGTRYISQTTKYGELFKRWSFRKANSFPILWDTDYPPVETDNLGLPPTYEFGPAKTYPPPKAAHNGTIVVRFDTGRADSRGSYEGRLISGSALDWNEETSPDPDDMVLDLLFAGEAFTVNADDGEFWMSITASPDGTDELAVDFSGGMPLSVPDGSFTPSDPSANFVASGEFLATIRQINAQFDLNSVYTYGG